MVGQTISHYRIINKLGEGGMGVVYLAEDTVLGRHVAIKTLTDGGLGRQHFRTRFLREARAVSALSHANIATIYDYGETPQGNPYIVMEFVRGETLADLISEGKLSLERAVEIIIDVARALGEAHRHGIVHRDIKPSNIAISESGEVKVLDFGLAKHVETDNNSTITREGVMLGTPMYISPEQAMGVSVDPRSDLFSLGSVLYECVTGQPPFAGSSSIEICAKVIRDDPAPPSSFNPLVGPELDRISLKSLAKKPDERYQSAELCIDDLRAAAQLPKHAATEQTLRDVPSNKWRFLKAWPTIANSRALISALVVSIIVLLGLGAAIRLWTMRGYQPSAEAKRSYDEGLRALQDGTYYKASKFLDMAIQSDKGFALARARHAEALAELGYFEKANTEISQANLLANNSSLSATDRLYFQAINSMVSQDFGGAAETYREIVHLGSDVNQQYMHVDLGRACEKNEDLQDAIANYDQAISLDPQYAPAFLRKGILYGRTQDFDKGKEALDKAFILYKLQSNPEGMAETLYQQGVLLVGKGELAAAREPLERALQIVETFTNPSQEVKTLIQLSNVFRQTRDPKTAQHYAAEALKAAEANGLSDLKTQSMIELGYTYFFQEDIPTAERYFKEALDLPATEKEKITEAKAQFALGSLYIQQDDADNGLPYIKSALPFYEKNKYIKEMMQLHTLLGQGYSLKGKLTEALAEFREQLSLSKRLNNQLQTGLSYKSIATALGYQEQYSEALNNIEQSYSIFSSLKNDLYVGYTLTSRAEMKWRLGRYEEANADLSFAMALAERPQNPLKQLWGRLYSVKAPMALSQREARNAIKDAEQAIKLDPSRTRHPAIEAMFTLGLAQFSSGDRRRGTQTCEQAVEMARNSGNLRLLLQALLALSEIQIDSGAAKSALANATTAQQLAQQTSLPESEWRALLLTGRADQQLGNYPDAREKLSKADSLLSSLRERFGAENYNSYLNRNDVMMYRGQLQKASAAIVVR
jgi:serine/threonine protein kinase/tetratricopeptide (TPR) repeat protein